MAAEQQTDREDLRSKGVHPSRGWNDKCVGLCLCDLCLCVRLQANLPRRRQSSILRQRFEKFQRNDLGGCPYFLSDSGASRHKTQRPVGRPVIAARKQTKPQPASPVGCEASSLGYYVVRPLLLSRPRPRSQEPCMISLNRRINLPHFFLWGS